MPPKRTKNIDVFMDDSENPSRSSSRNVKRKLPKTSDKPVGSQPKRQALGDKSKISNSRDTSLREIKRESPPVDPSPLKKERKVSAVETDALFSMDSKSTSSPVKTVAKSGIGISKHLKSRSSIFHQIQLLVDEERFQDAANLITTKGLWTPGLLAEFGATSIFTLDLSSPASAGFSIPNIPSSQLLAPLFTQHQFSTLSTISLRNTYVSADDIALLRVLPSLTTLDLCATGINNHALYHLVCHAHTLTSLNVSNNERITDEVRPVFSALPNLTALFLRGTNFSMPALRMLVRDTLPKGCRLLSMPSHAIEHLNNLQAQYCVEIPAGYVVDPVKVENMTLLILKKNLELHAKFNKDVQVTGTKVELAHRLRMLLLNRATDIMLLGVLGRGVG